MTFVKGQSGNPAGKPKGTRSFTTKVREALEKIAEGKDYSYEEAFIKSILKKAIIDGDSSTQRLIWNYLDGLPAQSMDLTSKGEKIFVIPSEIISKNDLHTDPKSENNSPGQS
jgi:hypothetical protein